MTKRTLAYLVLIGGAIGGACDGEGVFGPSLARVELMPTEAALFTDPPNNSVQLTIQAYDQRGRPIPDPGDATYSSSNPSIATVNGSGVVAAVAPGTAVINVTVTRAGVTRIISMAVTVGWDAVNGIYDLAAPVTIFDPAWGDLTGYRYTAVISFLHDSRYAPGIGGTYWDLRVTGPDGDEGWVGNGAITSHFDRAGRVVVELGSNFTLVLAGELVGPVLEGTFGAGGHIGGPFTASRREGQVESAAATVTWFEYAWHPEVIVVAAGDTVVWSLGDLTGNPGAIWIGDEVLPLVNGRAERVFPTVGEYWYCMASDCWDYGAGLVRVEPVLGP